MRVMLTLAFFGFIVLSNMGQTAGMLNVNAAPSGIVDEIDELEIIESEGSYYVLENWNQCIIFFKYGKQSSIENCKINLETLRLEIKEGMQLMALNLNYLDNIQLLEREKFDTIKYKTASNYLFDGKPLKGIVEIIVEGNTQLIVNHTLRKLQSNYIAGIDVGERAEKYVKHLDYYIVSKKRLFQIRNRRNTWLDDMVVPMEKTTKFIHENKISFRKREDLIKLVKFFNN